MPELAELFPGFATHRTDTSAGRLFARTGGEGPPLLLLHGYPQTHVMWHRVAPHLARHFTLVIPDLPGYGASDTPDPDASHAPYDKRSMAKAMTELMQTVAQMPPGSDAKFKVLRDGKTTDVNVKVVERPSQLSRR